MENATTPQRNHLEDRGQICMFVGYPDDHAADTLRMWDPRSRRVHVTRNIKWLNRMYFENPNMESDVRNSPGLIFGEGTTDNKNYVEDENCEDNSSSEYRESDSESNHLNEPDEINISDTSAVNNIVAVT
jgi:hypothetical protein